MFDRISGSDFDSIKVDVLNICFLSTSISIIFPESVSTVRVRVQPNNMDRISNVIAKFCLLTIRLLALF